MLLDALVYPNIIGDMWISWPDYSLISTNHMARFLAGPTPLILVPIAQCISCTLPETCHVTEEKHDAWK